MYVTTNYVIDRSTLQEESNPFLFSYYRGIRKDFAQDSDNLLNVTATFKKNLNAQYERIRKEV